MILLVPVSPETPPGLRPRFWGALIIVVMLVLSFGAIQALVEKDLNYVNSLENLITTDENGKTRITPEAEERLRVRPLTEIAPTRGDWDWRRLIYANFIHGSSTHLILNLVGSFAGFCLCSAFTPFLSVLSIFILGGSLGLLASLLLSSEISAYIPHVGASGGIFALMGAYYVFNFRFRTRYFFWFPTRHGLINLRTAPFFFIDVLLMELILSAAQLAPKRIDSVDHIAHVVGFAMGAVLALLIRLFLRWPSILQSRLEYNLWNLKRDDPRFSSLSLSALLELLHINPYNDHLKKRLFHYVTTHLDACSPQELEAAFHFATPTFIRLFPAPITAAVTAVLQRGLPLPRSWLLNTPYDSIIRMAQELSQTPEQTPILMDLVMAYRRASPEGGDVERKLELLLQKLSGVVQKPAKTQSHG